MAFFSVAQAIPAVVLGFVLLREIFVLYNPEQMGLPGLFPDPKGCKATARIFDEAT